MVEPIKVQFSAEGVEELRRAFAEVRSTSKRASVSAQTTSMSMTTAMQQVSESMSVFGTAGYNVLRVADALNLMNTEIITSIQGIITITSAGAELIRAIPAITSMLCKETLMHIISAVNKYQEAIRLSGKSLVHVIAFIVSLIAATALIYSAKSQTYGKGLAEGGIVTRPLYTLLGEAGPEAVIPLSQMRPRTINAWHPTFRSRGDVDRFVDDLERVLSTT